MGSHCQESPGVGIPIEKERHLQGSWNSGYLQNPSGRVSWRGADREERVLSFNFDFQSEIVGVGSYGV